MASGTITRSVSTARTTSFIWTAKKGTRNESEYHSQRIGWQLDNCRAARQTGEGVLHEQPGRRARFRAVHRNGSGRGINCSLVAVGCQPRGYRGGCVIMATLSELNTVMNEPTLNEKIRGAVLMAALAVQYEDAGTANHAN